MTSDKAGKLAEFLARSLFRLKGYKIIATNYITGKGTHAGEVDFIATRGKTIVFVEVKQRQNIQTAAEAITPDQQKRIWRAAEGFLQKNPKYQDRNIRFDAVLVSLPVEIKHIQDAWRL